MFNVKNSESIGLPKFLQKIIMMKAIDEALHVLFGAAEGLGIKEINIETYVTEPLSETNYVMTLRKATEEDTKRAKAKTGDDVFRSAKESKEAPMPENKEAEKPYTSEDIYRFFIKTVSEETVAALRRKEAEAVAKPVYPNNAAESH